VQDVEVGDFYYESKKYRAALSRYESALRSKASDPGILLRLGKTAEKLGDGERAAREFQASIDAAPDGPTAKDAKSGLARTSKNAN
jgi:tetratricopeptide (TPR) repeat protein